MAYNSLYFGDIFEFEINIPKELSGIPVPKLSIQPLAENALYHGLFRHLFVWHITVYILGIYLNIELVFPVKTNKYFSHFGKKR